MAVTGWIFPTKHGDPVDDWRDGANLYTDNGLECRSATVNDVEDTRGYDYEVALPVGSRIDGIEVEVEAAPANWLGFGPETATLQVSMSATGVFYSGAESYGWVGSGLPPAAPEKHIFGGATDTWGLTWPLVDGGNLRIRIAFTASSDNNIDFSGVAGGVDYVAMRVYYTQIHTISVNGSCVQDEDQIITVG